VTPHRIPPATSAAAGVLRQAFAMPTEPGPGVAAGLLALATAFYNLHVVVLLILVVFGGVIDLWTGSRRARIRSRLGESGGYDRAVLDEGISGKTVALVVILFLGVAIDSVVSLAGGAAELGIGGVFATYTPATAALLAYRLAREISSISENLDGTPGGRDAIWPGVKRFVDGIRFQLIHPEAKDAPERRWDDGLSDADRAWVVEMLAARKAQEEGKHA